MTLPGFTAEVASFSRLKENYHYWSTTKSEVYVEQEVASSTMNTPRSNRWKMIPEPQKEPTESGRRAWSALGNACNNLQCDECRSDCVRFVNGLHDAINIKLGKPVKSPNDFVYLRDFVNEMSKLAFLH
jgi:hypothetical protein